LDSSQDVVEGAAGRAERYLMLTVVCSLLTAVYALRMGVDHGERDAGDKSPRIWSRGR